MLPGFTLTPAPLGGDSAPATALTADDGDYLLADDGDFLLDE